jgi:hypothetical protein
VSVAGAESELDERVHRAVAHCLHSERGHAASRSHCIHRDAAYAGHELYRNATMDRADHLARVGDRERRARIGERLRGDGLKCEHAGSRLARGMLRWEQCSA